ncbi:sulfatase [Paracoccus sp. PAR01]|uniref:sulfatase family protein n=1 Tax=Paracoccus sp. PAR01 TaxID=2769282 RepID=UPI0017826784|nr:sulfatase-like hydrolase/transferase [Paracoccus sp. PAR01]MBD9527163.1 sulfatase-like hydrolase/transferase [Paracoccus sp. PAR01]
MSAPHLVVIMADQLRHDLIGPEHTPHIAELAGESMVFPNAYCASPLCVPSRGAFFTGRYPNQTGCLINPWVPEDAAHGMVAEGTPNLYGLLAGDWDGHHAGKQHLCYDPPLERRGGGIHWQTLEDTYAPALAARGHAPPGGPDFRADLPEQVGGRRTWLGSGSTPATGCYQPGFDSFFDGHILNGALSAIDRRDRAKPLFLSAMFLAPHPPFHIPEPWYSMVRDIQMPRNVGRWSPGQSPLQLYNMTGIIGTRYSRDEWHEVWRVYAGLVRLLDHCVGQIVARLKAQGIYDDTAILLTSDHGEMLGSHRLFQKMCMYEEAIRTPVVLKLPKGGGQGIDPRLVSHIDVLPTLCEVLDVTPPAGLPGRSLLQDTPPRPVFVQYDGNGSLGNFSRAVIRGTDKLIVDSFKDERFFELYDLARDPQEEHNLIATQPARAAALLALLGDHMRATGDHMALDQGDLDRFRHEHGMQAAD